MIVADGALAGEAEPGIHHRGGAIERVAEDVFGIDRAALARRDIAAIEAGGDELLLRRVGQQIARDLLDGELIERQIAVVSIDHPIAIRPDRALVIQMQPVRVAIARLVQPMMGHLLAIARRSEQPIHHLFVSVRRVDRARKASTSAIVGGRPVRSKRHPAQQRRAIRFRRRLQPLLFQPRPDKAIDRILIRPIIPIPPIGPHLPRAGAAGRTRPLKRPMLLIRRALLDPALDRSPAAPP